MSSVPQKSCQAQRFLLDPPAEIDPLNVFSSGMFKHPEHVARKTRGEMEPSDVELSAGKFHPDSQLSERISGLLSHFITALSSHPKEPRINGLCASAADMKDPLLKSTYYFTLVTVSVWVLIKLKQELIIQVSRIFLCTHNFSHHVKII